MAEFKAIETQEELDRIIGERLKRERDATEKKYADFETLKEKAARYDEIEKKDFAGCARTASVPLTQKPRCRRLLLQIQKVRAYQIIVLQEPVILVLKSCQK